MHCPAQRKIGLHIILQPIEYLTLAIKFPDEIRVIHDFVQNGKPVSGRSFGGWPVGPELCQNPGIIATRYQLGFVGQARFGINRPTISGRSASLEIVKLLVFIQRHRIR